MRDRLRRLVTIPTREERIRARAGAPLNPFKVMAMLTPLQALFFVSGWMAWTIDAVDFFAVSLNITRLTHYFNFGTSNQKVTAAITLTVLLRPVGGIIFGCLADAYGRKWPFIFNLLLAAAFSLATARVQTYAQFLAVRSLFGVAMGGMWGCAMTLALENMPDGARGFHSGVAQAGYPLGYILVAIVNIAWVNHNDNWRILFYFGAVVTLLVAAFRLVLPESPQFVKMQEKRKARAGKKDDVVKVFVKEVSWLAKNCSWRLVYGILLVVGLSFLAHASQDLYPVIAQKSKLLSPHDTSVAVIVGMTGGVLGGITAGFVSQYIGRRLTLLIYTIISGLLVPAWMLPNTFSGLAAGAFFLQWFVQGMGGVLPALLQDMAPARYRASFVGVIHQTGVMITASSAQIEAVLGEKKQIPNPKYVPGGTEPKTIPDYAMVSAYFLAIVAAYLVVLVVFGPDYDARPRLGTADDDDDEDGAENMVQQGKAGDEEEAGSGITGGQGQTPLESGEAQSGSGGSGGHH